LEDDQIKMRWHAFEKLWKPTVQHRVQAPFAAVPSPWIAFGFLAEAIL
jgi:hypothetical protein